MRPDFMDEVCENYIRVEEDCANMVIVDPILNAIDAIFMLLSK